MIGREAEGLTSTLSVSGTLAIVEETGGGMLGIGSIRGGPLSTGRLSCAVTSIWDRSDVTRSGILSALGPVGGATGPDGGLLLGTIDAEETVEAEGAMAGGTGAEDAAGGGAMTGGLGATGAGLAVCTGLRGGNGGGGAAAAAAAAAAVLGFPSSAVFLQSLDPKAGTAAGGDEARGAYLSLDASARLANRRSSFPGSRRESLTPDESTAVDGRREYESTCGPNRSAGDA